MTYLPCEFVLDDFRDCGRPSALAVGALFPLSDHWKLWPVCSTAHARAISRACEPVIEISEPFMLGDDVARDRACPKPAPLYGDSA